MVEALLVCAGIGVGFAIAWFIGGKIREQLAEARVKLVHTEQRLHETQVLLTATQANLAEVTNALNVQSAMRAAAEALNSRIPQLEEELETLRTEAAERQAEISQIRARAEEQSKAAAEKLKLVTDVLLNRIASIDARANLAEHFVPGASDLRTQISAQRCKIFVEAAIAVARAHAQEWRPFKVIATSRRAIVAVLAASRPFDDDLVHILTHNYSDDCL